MNKSVIESLKNTCNFNASVASILRNISLGAGRYLYDDEIWRETLIELCKNSGSMGGVVKFVCPSAFMGRSDISVAVDGHDLDPSLKASFVSSGKEATTVPLHDHFKIIPFEYVGYISCRIFLVFSYQLSQEEQKYLGYLVNNTLSAIEEHIKRELRHYIGQRRVDGKGREEVDLSYLFRTKKNAIYMFVDIRNFTPLTELLRDRGGLRIGDTEIVYPTIDKLLTEYCEAVSNDILRFGRVDKFLGDGIMAIFGDMMEPTRWDIEAVKAVCSAFRITETFKKLRDRWEADWLHYHNRQYAEEVAPILGVGIHRGDASFNFYGPMEHKEFTAIGDAVNVAQRIESNAGKDERQSILISQPIYYLLKDARNELKADILLDRSFVRHSLSLKGKSHIMPVWGIESHPEEICQTLMKEICSDCWFHNH